MAPITTDTATVLPFGALAGTYPFPLATDGTDQDGAIGTILIGMGIAIMGIAIMDMDIMIPGVITRGTTVIGALHHTSMGEM